MASRMLHYTIAKQIVDRIEIKDRNRFFIGSLLPDASSHENGSYNIAHFHEELLDRSRKGYNWNTFYMEYQEDIQKDSLYQGYLCHLVADAVWFKRMIDRYIRIYPKKDRINYIHTGYEDFVRMNQILAKEYNLTYPSLSIGDISIAEIEHSLVEPLITQFKEDFIGKGTSSRSEMSVYPYESVQEFIQETVAVCINEINAVNGKADFTDPTIYYTEHRP